MIKLTTLMSLLSLGMICLTTYWLRRGRIAVRSFLVWTLVWAGMLFFSLFPDILIWLANLASMELRAYFVFVAAIVFIILMLYFNSLTQGRDERAIDVLVQEVALLKFKIEQMENERKED